MRSDIDRYKRQVARLDLSGIDFGAFPALHMTWGAVNEWTTQAAYTRLSTRGRATAA